MQAEEISAEDNKREYSRVDAYIAMECRRLEEEELDKVRSRISGETFLAEFESPGCRIITTMPRSGIPGDSSQDEWTGPPEIEDPRLADWLRIINVKLDAVIRMLTIQNEGFLRLPLVRVNIGGGGLSFKSQDEHAAGDIVEIKMMLSLHRPIAMYVYGEVIEIKKQETDSEVAVKFILIDDGIRDEIVRFVFEREREILREKRR